ncbi:MAG: aldehyde dehydrogenase family protein [Vicinamibacterales bacterium]
MQQTPLFLAGRDTASDRALEVLNPYDGGVVGRTSLATQPMFEEAITSAERAAPFMRAMPVFERAAILTRVSQSIRDARDEIGRLIALEAGKPIRDALTEVDRGAMTFQVAAEEARRIAGEVIPLDLAPHGTGRFAVTRRFPLGPVAAISPFNFPFNLVAHKLAPAIAAGNPVVLKPATKTPLTALKLAGLIRVAGLPDGALSVLPMARELGDRLVTDPRFKLLTFTGSSAVGWGMKERAGRKRVILELGGNAGVIVDETADLDHAARRVAAGGFAYAGQSCISVQRVYVHRQVFDGFCGRLVALVEKLRLGDPLDPETDVGPMVEPEEAERVEKWVQEAVASGARIVTGGRRIGRSMYAPTILTGVPADARVCTQEVFAPLVGLYRFDDFGAALSDVNRSSYGLQAGVFTKDIGRAFRGFEGLEVGGVMINDVPTYRIDHMPYGGVKDSGLGREGPRYAIEEMTELKLMVINLG